MMLIVIDMQPEFVNKKSPREAMLIGGVRREVDEARVKGWPILIVEYGGAGPTFVEITAGLTDYDKVAHVTKWHDDGSPEIAEAIHSHGWGRQASNIHVCGVNCEYCVKKSVVGLTKLFPRSTFEVGTTNSETLSTPAWVKGNSQLVWNN